ncbi:RICIN domain-containing protein [Streptomyces sp. NPDC002809]|uniref:RICIN domain-containing protein n=1 Tax=Streptomyces sp. NPDC002809 TaxID=3154433 RepID=UPI00331D8282
MAVAAVVTGAALMAGGGAGNSSRQADALTEGPVRSDGEDMGVGGQSLLPGVPTADPTAPPSVTPSATPSSSSSKSAPGTPGRGKSTASLGSGSSSAADDPGTDSVAKPGSGNSSGSTTVSGGALAVEASGKCLTGAGPGSQLVASACAGSVSQSWSPEPDGTLRQGGLCAAVTGTEDRTPVVLATCDGSSVQRIRLSGTALTSASTGKCLDLFGGASGTQIVLWECNGRDNQRWSAA